ncbi:hypothetical protein ACWHY4_16260 [Pseudomonas sp. E2-15]
MDASLIPSIELNMPSKKVMPGAANEQKAKALTVPSISLFSDPDNSDQANLLIQFLDQFDQLPHTRILREHAYARQGTPGGWGST